jgi:hypothetical protein
VLFPAGEYTPFGYLKNPGHRATSGWAVEGGNLRSAPDWLGIEWVYPLHRRPTARHGLSLEMPGCSTRTDFDTIGLTSRYHSSNILGFDWRLDQVRVEARYFLVDNDTLCTRVEIVNTGVEPRTFELGIVCQSWEGEPTGLHHVATGSLGMHILELQPGQPAMLVATLGRGATQEQARRSADQAIDLQHGAFERLVAEDDAFYATCPELFGDWPATWREGLIHDFETTRLLVLPPGGIFEDVWPTWMAAWPRVVLAEGTLDMLRLAYADPGLAQRAILTMFRDAPMSNVPCVFEDGSCNMVAADGSCCGTSPAWCLPFLNLELLYLRTLDRAWLRELFPYLTAYLDWWLTERVDDEGWVVYKCTWEAGEDGNPRLDPSASGDRVIADRVRPVELQATMAHAAEVLALFAGELQRTRDVQRWQDVAADYRRRTRELFDPREGRYRDWLTQEQRFQSARPDQPYWGVDSCRYAPLALTPLLVGEPLSADEVWRHARPPWTMWPSWTWALVESASAAGLFKGVATLASEIVERVYRVTTRRELGSLERPLPGASPEFWPEDWRTFDGSDAYGWGATTANLVLRHIFGFRESRETRTWTAVLTPHVPPGAQHFGVRRLQYRGLSLTLAYAVGRAGLLAELDLGQAMRRCVVLDDGELRYDSAQPRARHEFTVQPDHAYRLELT